MSRSIESSKTRIALAVAGVLATVGCNLSTGPGSESNPSDGTGKSPAALEYTPSPTATQELVIPTATPNPTETSTPTLLPVDAKLATVQALQTETQAYAPTETSIPKVTLTPTETPTPSSTPTPESTPTPTATMTPVTSVVENLHPSIDLSYPGQLDVETQSDGLVSVRYYDRRQYLASQVDNRDPNIINEEDAAFDAQWLGRNPRNGLLETIKTPNFFTHEHGAVGRGWTAEMVQRNYFPDLHAFSDAPINERFGTNPDFDIQGAAFVSSFRNIKQGLATFAVQYVLQEASPSDLATDETIRAYLVAHNDRILDLEDQLWSQTGIKLEPAAGQSLPENRPSALDTYLQNDIFEDYEIVDGRVCVTFMSGSRQTDRPEQREGAVEARIQEGLEATSGGNNETLSDIDLDAQLELFLSAQRKNGVIVVDVTRVTDIDDYLDGGEASPDAASGIQKEGYVGRLISCGAGFTYAESPEGVVFVTPEAIITIPTLPPERTPGGPDETPETPETPGFPTVTPVIPNTSGSAPTATPGFPTGNETLVPTPRSTDVPSSSNPDGHGDNPSGDSVEIVTEGGEVVGETGQQGGSDDDDDNGGEDGNGGEEGDGGGEGDDNSGYDGDAEEAFND